MKAKYVIPAVYLGIFALVSFVFYEHMDFPNACHVNTVAHYGTVKSYTRLHDATEVFIENGSIIVRGYPPVMVGDEIDGGYMNSRWCPSAGFYYYCIGKRCNVGD